MWWEVGSSYRIKLGFRSYNFSSNLAVPTICGLSLTLSYPKTFNNDECFNRIQTNLIIPYGSPVQMTSPLIEHCLWPVETFYASFNWNNSFLNEIASYSGRFPNTSLFYWITSGDHRKTGNHTWKELSWLMFRHRLQCHAWHFLSFFFLFMSFRPFCHLLE